MKFFRSKTIRSRLVKILVFAIGGVAVIGAAVWRFSIEPALRMNKARNHQEVARRAADQIQEFIEGRVEELLTVAQIGRFWEMDRQTQREALYRLMKLDPQVREVSIADREGKEILRISRSRVYVDADMTSWDREEKFRQAIEGKSYIGQVHHVPTEGPFVTLAVPIKLTARDIKGVMAAEISLKNLWDSISYIKVGKSGYAFVVDLRGNLIAHPDYSKVLLGSNMAHLQGVKEFLAGPDRVPDFGEIVIGQEGKRVISTLAVVKGLGWGVFAVEPTETALAEIKRMERLGLMVFAFMLAGVFGVGYWFSGRIVRPVRELEQGAKLVAQGDLEHKLKIHTGDEIESLANQFNQMAKSLRMRQDEAKRAEEQIQHNLERIRALHEIGLATSSTLDLRAVLNVLMEKIDLLLPYTAVLVWLLDRKTGLVERAACWNLNEEEWKGRKMKGTPALVKAAVEGKEPVVATNVQTDPRTMDAEFYRKHGLVSYLGVPLVVKGEVLGVLVFLTREEHEFTDDEVVFLSTLGGQVAVAIHNSQLYEQSKNQALELEKANAGLKRREEIQKLLKELSQDIPSLDIDSLLRKLTTKVRQFLHVDITDVRLFEGEVWELRGVSGIDPGRLPSSWIRSTGSRQRSIWIRENRRALMIPDITKGPIESLGRVLESRGVRGFLGVPILSRSGEVVGVLRALTYEPRHFTEEEVDLLQQLANGTAIALENARLLAETKKQAVELEEANKAKDEFLGFMSHELRTPLNVITGYVEMLRDRMFGKINKEQEKALGKVASHSKDLLAMITGILQATSLEAGAVKVKSDEVSLGDLLDELKSTYGVPLGKELTVKWDYPSEFPVVRTDGEKLKHILENLINNAIKFTERGSVTVTARPLPVAVSPSPRFGDREKRGNGAVEFKVADTGIGIPKESLPIIFEKFRQLDGSNTREHGGVGLGLHIVKSFTELLGGMIRVESELGKGSTFTVTIPCENQ